MLSCSHGVSLNQLVLLNSYMCLHIYIHLSVFVYISARGERETVGCRVLTRTRRTSEAGLGLRGKLSTCQKSLRLLITCRICRSPSSSQYPNLWSVSNSTITPAPQSSGMSNGLSSQFLRGSPVHYTTLPHPVTATTSTSPLYDGGAPADLPDSQYDASAHTRLASMWTPITPPSM